MKSERELVFFILFLFCLGLIASASTAPPHLKGFAFIIVGWLIAFIMIPLIYLLWKGKHK